MGMTHLINPFVEELTKSDKRRLDAMLEELIEANTQAGNPRHGFTLAGEFHTLRDPRSIPRGQKKLLHPDLVTQGEAYMRERETWRKEITRLKHGLAPVLDSCHSAQDVRDMLPDEVKGILGELKGLSRTRPEGFLFENQPLRAHDFERTKELISFYVANRLLY